MSCTRLQIFSRAPRLGKVKTRLEPFLGKDGCLALHRSLVKHAMDMASKWDLGKVELWLADSEQDTAVDSITSNNSSYAAQLDACIPSSAYLKFIRAEFNLPDDIDIYFQKGENLGSRMQFALQSAIDQGDSSVLIGTDCPKQKISHLLDAAALLKNGAKMVVQPAEDGGFVLIAYSALDDQSDAFIPVPDISYGIDWGTSQVLNQLDKRLSGLGVEYDKIVTLPDLDTKEDFLLLQKDSDPEVVDFCNQITSSKMY